jgi:hypothetical protein
VNALWKDKANLPAEAQQKMLPYGNPKVWEFIQEAMAAGKKGA